MEPVAHLPEPEYFAVMFAPVREHADEPLPSWLAWWRRHFCDQEFGHVSLAFYMPETTAWTLISSNYGGTAVYSLPGAWHLGDIMDTIHANKVVIIRRTADGKGWRRRGLLTCVSVVKSILGISDWWCITPAQLWRVLQRHVAEQQERGD